MHDDCRSGGGGGLRDGLWLDEGVRDDRLGTPRTEPDGGGDANQRRRLLKCADANGEAAKLRRGLTKRDEGRSGRCEKGEQGMA